MNRRKTLDLAGAVHGAAQPPAPPPTTSTPGLGRSRQGKRGILNHVESEMARRLKHPAVERDTTLQALGIEALTRLLGDAAQ